MKPIPCDTVACFSLAAYSHRGSTGRLVYRCPDGHVQVFEEARHRA